MLHLNQQIDPQISKQFINVINSQVKLIDKLLYNQKHLLESIRTLSETGNTSFSSSILNHQKANDCMVSKIKHHELCKEAEQSCKIILPMKIKHLQKMNELFKQKMSVQSFKQKSDQQSDCKTFKISQTKNVIKNFSKSLFRFIQKHRVYVSKVLMFLKIKQQEFQCVLQRFKGNIYTIQQLKKLWLEEGNHFYKAFRIVSSEYLRKHSLYHIFNSRVVNYKTHIKYRRKMNQILQNPQEFSSIKYF